MTYIYVASRLEAIAVGLEAIAISNSKDDLICQISKLEPSVQQKVTLLVIIDLQVDRHILSSDPQKSCSKRAGNRVPKPIRSSKFKQDIRGEATRSKGHRYERSKDATRKESGQRPLQTTCKRPSLFSVESVGRDVGPVGCQGASKAPGSNVHLPDDQVPEKLVAPQSSCV